MKPCDFALHLVEITKIFRRGVGQRSLEAVSRLNLAVVPGEIFGVLGPNGAGKSTAFRISTGLVRPTAGQGWIYNRPIGTTESLRLIGYLPDQPAFYEYLTARESLTLCGRLAGMRADQVHARVEELLIYVGLHAAGDRQLRRFSKGMLQRIGIAQAIVHDPQLVILDEPMSGLDPVGRAKISALILDLKRRGKTIVLSTHVLEDVETLCDRVGLLIGGRCVAVERSADLFQQHDSPLPGDPLLNASSRRRLADVIARYVADDERCVV
jgi:ABC-2 type transport system ATP-binding protein